jgi:hypothetical protein
MLNGQRFHIRNSRLTQSRRTPVQSQYAPLRAYACGGETVETLADWNARAAEDRQLTVRDVWGLMLHSVRGERHSLPTASMLVGQT